MSSFASNLYLAYLRACGALTTDPASLKPYAALADNTTDPKTYALTLSACNGTAGILAIGHNSKVLISHHFLFDMKTPFAPASSDARCALTSTFNETAGTKKLQANDFTFFCSQMLFFHANAFFAGKRFFAGNAFHKKKIADDENLSSYLSQGDGGLKKNNPYLIKLVRK
jgi:hypothetical protein